MIKINYQGDSLFSAYFSHSSTTEQLGFDVLDFQEQSQYWLFTGGMYEYGWTHNSEIVKMDYSGNILDTVFLSPPWSPTPNIGDEKFYGAVTAKWLSDTTFIVTLRNNTITSVIPNRFERDLAVSVRDINDSIYFLKKLGKTDTLEIEPITGVDFIHPDEIYVAGTTNVDMTTMPYFSNDISQFILYQINNTGDVLWENCYGNNTYLTLTHVLATKDGGCLLTGSSYDKNKATEPERDIFIIKVDKYDNSNINIEEIEEEKNNHMVYPNPFSNQISIHYNGNLPATIEVYDFKGGLFFSEKITRENTAIPTATWPQQLYFYRIIEVNGNVLTGKLSKSR